MTERAESSAEQELAAWRGREHILIALVRAQTDRQQVLEIVSSSDNVADGRARLKAEFGVDEIQATAMMDMQILRLVVSERLRVEKELADVQTRIARLVGQLSDRRAFPPRREEAG